MAREGITYEQVSAVADALMAEGLRPAIRAVRERLGFTGSPNTIHKHLSAWREARPVAVAAAPELPRALTAAIAAEIARTASEARAEIEARLVQAQGEATDLAAAGEALEGERDELIEQVAALTSERDTLAGKASQQAVDLADQAQRIEREQQAAEAARVELATARLKIEAQAERLTEQGAELERLRQVLEVEGKARIGAEQQAAVLAARLEAATADAQRVGERAERAEQLAAQTAAALENARATAADARENVARLSGQVESLQAQQQAQTGEIERLRALAAKKPSEPKRAARPKGGGAAA